MFGLLRDVRLRVFCGTAICGVWVPSAHIAPFLSVVNTQQAFLQPYSQKPNGQGKSQSWSNDRGSTLMQLSSS
jgi:hypothetical protein